MWTKPCLLAILLVLTCSSPALAWNGVGHMLVADFAWAQIAAVPAVLAAVSAIIRRAKSGFQPAGNSVTELRDAFDYAATFPDVLKKDAHTAYEPMVKPMNDLFWPGHGPDPDAGREKNRCKTWHYYDTPINFHEPKPEPWPSNLIVAYGEAIKRLGELHSGNYTGPSFTGITNDDLNFWWLAWILHFVGDAHQPLHCVSNYAFSDQGDNGGNLFEIPGGELHAFWDGILVAAATADGFHISDVERIDAPSNKLAPVVQA